MDIAERFLQSPIKRTSNAYAKKMELKKIVENKNQCGQWCPATDMGMDMDKDKDKAILSIIWKFIFYIEVIMLRTKIFL